MTNVYDLQDKRLLWSGEGRSKATLEAFFECLGPEKTAAIEGICCDMWQPYIEVVKDRAPQAGMVCGLEKPLSLTSYREKIIAGLSRGHFPAKCGSWDISRGRHDKHVIFVNGFRTHGMLRAPLNGPYVACRRRGTPP